MLSVANDTLPEAGRTSRFKCLTRDFVMKLRELPVSTEDSINLPFNDISHITLDEDDESFTVARYIAAAVCLKFPFSVFLHTLPQCPFLLQLLHLLSLAGHMSLRG